MPRAVWVDRSWLGPSKSVWPEPQLMPSSYLHSLLRGVSKFFGCTQCTTRSVMHPACLWERGGGGGGGGPCNSCVKLQLSGSLRAACGPSLAGAEQRPSSCAHETCLDRSWTYGQASPVPITAWHALAQAILPLTTGSPTAPAIAGAAGRQARRCKNISFIKSMSKKQGEMRS